MNKKITMSEYAPNYFKPHRMFSDSVVGYPFTNYFEGVNPDKSQMIVLKNPYEAVFRCSRFIASNSYAYEARELTKEEIQDLELSLYYRKIIENLIKTKNNKILFLQGDLVSIFHAMLGFNIIGDSDQKIIKDDKLIRTITHDLFDFSEKQKTEENIIAKIYNNNYTIADYSNSDKLGVEYEIWFDLMFKPLMRKYKDYDNEIYNMADKDNIIYYEPSILYFPKYKVLCCYDNIFTSPGTKEKLYKLLNEKITEKITEK